MTNVEKAVQICCSDCDFVNKGIKWCSPCTGAKVGIPKMAEMAEWKDKEFLSIIEDKLNYARDMIKENHNESVRLKYEGMRKILIEIKNELKAK